MSGLTDERKIEVLRLTNEGMSIRKIEELLGIPRSTIGHFLTRKTHKHWWSENAKPIAGGVYDTHHKNIPSLRKRRYIITSAQNNTFVHANFLKSLEVMAAHIGAQIIVGTFSYNLSGFQNLSKGDGEWFDPKIEKYIIDSPAILAEGLLWCGELNILPTAANPLSGLHSYTKDSSGIIPHAKVQLETLPSHKSEAARMLYTTGAVTKRNYIQKKAGQKASFHHIFGALVVEVDTDGDWFVRQLSADKNGEFYDLSEKYTPDGVSHDHRVDAITWGDLHTEKRDDVVYDISFGKRKDSIMDTLKPKTVFANDILDFTARNHHNINDPYFRFKMFIERRESVRENINMIGEVLREIYRPFCKTVINESNHDLAMHRWLRDADYRSDPANAVFFLECQLAQYKALERGESDFSIFEHSVKDMFPDVVATFLRRDESYKVNGIECGCHGDLGANGAKGSVTTFQRLGTRYTVGHTHTACIRDGVYYAGVSGKLDMGYNKGASTWSHSHCVQYENGKRTIITIKNGKWRG